jgi:sugar lactone lactonase YvrE
MSHSEIHLAFDVRAAHGEGALWDWRRGTLVSVDLTAARLFVSDPQDGSTVAIDVGQAVGAAALRGERELLLAVRDGFATVDLETHLIEPVAAVEEDQPGQRMNDAACDPRGRFFAGTMTDDGAEPVGVLYRLDPDLSVQPVFHRLSISNGIGWSPSGDHMYFIDSRAGGIEVYDYDLETGTPSNGRRLAATPPEWGLPDGLAVDAEGGVWVAFWDGGCLRRFDPSGVVTAVLEMPAARPSRPAFGGERLDRLYVTTAMLDDAEARAGDGGGAIYVTEPGVRGLPSPLFAG